MKTKYALIVALAVLLGANVVSAETSLALDVAFGVRQVPPSNVTVPTGERVMVTGPSLPGERAQWTKDGRVIEGATNATYVIPSATASDSGIYVYGSSQSLLLNVGAQQRFLNLSTRASAGVGEQTLIAGFVVTGPKEKAVLIRAIGPSLAKFGITGFLREPVIKIYDSTGKLYTNDYVYAAVIGVGKQESIANAAKATGAFPLLEGAKDAVDLRPFPAGAYSVHVTSSDGSSGIALVELYEVP